MDLTKIAIITIAGIAIVEGIALMKGIDGTALSAVIGAFSAILGAIVVKIKESKSS